MAPTSQPKPLAQLLYKWRKQIVIWTIVSVACAALFSGPAFIEPLYSSEVILYPPSTNSNRMLVERDVRFGSDKEIDEQIQLLRSAVVRDSVIRKFNLMKHYNIDTTSYDKKYRLQKEYDELVTIERTRYNSISVSVMDVDPARAAAMANYIVATGDQLKAAIVRLKLKEAFDQLAKSIFDLSMDLDQTSDIINKSFGKEVVSGSQFNKQNSIEQLKEQLDLKGLMAEARNNKKTQQLEQLYYYESKLQQLSTLQISYDQALVGMNNQIPSSFIISPAEIADHKTWPVRWMICLITAIGALFCAAGVIVVVDNLKRLRQTISG